MNDRYIKRMPQNPDKRVKNKMMLWWPGAQTTVSLNHCDTSFDQHSDNGADQNCIAINTTSTPYDFHIFYINFSYDNPTFQT